MIIASRRYVAGRVTIAELPLDGRPRGETPPGTFDWIGLYHPDAAEMALLQAQFGLHPLAVEDALNPMQMPKVDAYGQQLFIVARTAAIEEGDKIGYGQTALFLGRDFIATVRFGSERDHSAVRNRLEAAAEHLIEGPDYVAHAILDFVVDGYHPIMEKLEEAVQAIEERAIDAFPEPSTIRRIFRLRRQLRRFVRIVGPMEEVCERLSTTELPVIDAGARIWYRDVLDHMRRTMRRIAGLNETLASVVETASSARAAPPGHNDPATRGLGRDTGRADRYRRDLWHEFRLYARIAPAVGLSRGSGSYHPDMRRIVAAVSTDRLALT